MAGSAGLSPRSALDQPIHHWEWPSHLRLSDCDSWSEVCSLSLKTWTKNLRRLQPASELIAGKLFSGLFCQQLYRPPWPDLLWHLRVLSGNMGRSFLSPVICRCALKSLRY